MSVSVSYLCWSLDKMEVLLFQKFGGPLPPPCDTGAPVSPYDDLLLQMAQLRWRESESQESGAEHSQIPSGWTQRVDPSLRDSVQAWGLPPWYPVICLHDHSLRWEKAVSKPGKCCCGRARWELKSWNSKGGATGNGYISKQVGVTSPVILEVGPGNVPKGSESRTWANIGTPRP